MSQPDQDSRLVNGSDANKGTSRHGTEGLDRQRNRILRFKNRGLKGRADPSLKRGSPTPEHWPAPPTRRTGRVSGQGSSPTTAQQIDEDFLHQLMSAELGDVQNQLDVIMEGIGATDLIPKGLSTLSQFLLYRQQLLNNPGLGPWIVADWKALRTFAGRASLIRKNQRPFASLKDDERSRCARYLPSSFAEAVPPNLMGEAEFASVSYSVRQAPLGGRPIAF